MELKNVEYILYEGRPVKEVWKDYELIWEDDMSTPPPETLSSEQPSTPLP
jgi:hypothetical protein